MKKENLILILGLLVCACTTKKSNEILGKYVNEFDKESIHYVILKPDSTYLHYYKKNDQEQKNTGKWRFELLSNSRNVIIFHDWVSYGIKTEISCDGCMYGTDLADNEIVFSEDLAEKVNF